MTKKMAATTAKKPALSEASIAELIIAASTRIVENVVEMFPGVNDDNIPTFLAGPVDTVRQHFFNVPIAHVVIEIILAVWLVYIIFFDRTRKVPKAERLTEAEKQELIDTWKPEPLCQPMTGPPKKVNIVGKAGRNGTIMVVNDTECLNFATFNFLGLSHGCPEMKAAALKCADEHAVGSCGPPGFYGTIDPHKDLEKRFRDFIGTEEVILYSYGFSAVASAIPAYSKRGDIIFCDEGVAMPIRMGVVASRSAVVDFKHNDMDHLERLLLAQEEKDKKDGYKQKKKQRRFVVVEGLYVNHGDITDMHRLCQLRLKYNVRVFVDESLSFGVLGDTGRGVLELFGLDISDVDMMTGSFENAFGSIGGFAAGTKYLIDHQRLAGLGYCFSASLPPLLASASVAALDVMRGKPELFKTLQKTTKYLRTKLATLPEVVVEGSMKSPLIHIRLKERNTVEAEEAILTNICEHMQTNKVAVAPVQFARDMDLGCPPPSIRVCISAAHTVEDIDTVFNALKDAIEHTLSYTHTMR